MTRTGESQQSRNSGTSTRTRRAGGASDNRRPSSSIRGGAGGPGRSGHPSHTRGGARGRGPCRNGDYCINAICPFRGHGPLSFVTLLGKLARGEIIQEFAKLWILNYTDETNIMEFLSGLRDTYRLNKRREWVRDPMLPWILLAYKSQKCNDDTECTFQGCLRGHTGKDLISKEQFVNGGLDSVPSLPWGIRSCEQCHKKDRDERHEAARLAYVAELEEAKGPEEEPPATWDRPENPEAHILEYWEVEEFDLKYFWKNLDAFEEWEERPLQKKIAMYGSTILRAFRTYFIKCRVVKTYTNEEGWNRKTAARRWIPVIRAAGGVEGYLESLRTGEAKEPEMPTGVHCDECAFVCASDIALEKHRKKNHPHADVDDKPALAVEAPVKTVKVPDDLRCPHCDRQCKTKKIWKAHTKNCAADDDSDSDDEIILGAGSAYTHGGAGGAGGPDPSQAFTTGEAQLLKEEEEAASMVITLTLTKHIKDGDRPTCSLSLNNVPVRLIPRLLPLLKKIDGPFSKLNKQLKTIKTRPGKQFGDDKISQCVQVLESVCKEYTIFLDRN